MVFFETAFRVRMFEWLICVRTTPSMSCENSLSERYRSNHSTTRAMLVSYVRLDFPTTLVQKAYFARRCFPEYDGYLRQD